MLSIYKTSTDGRIELVPDIGHNTWLHLVTPTDTELNKISETLNVPLDILMEPLDASEQPYILRRGDIVLIVIHVPIPQAEGDALVDRPPYRMLPLGILHLRDHLITIVREDHPLFHAFFSGRISSFATHMKTRITLKIISATSQAYLTTVSRLERMIAQTEEELARTYRNPELYKLMNINETLLYMRMSLKQMIFVLRKIMNGGTIKLYDDDVEVLEDAMIELEQAHDAASVHQSTLNSVMDAYGNVIQINVNGILKLLTALTVIVAVPTLIASMFSMNVPLYIEDHPHGFELIMAVIMAVTGVFTYVFYRLRYF